MSVAYRLLDIVPRRAVVILGAEVMTMAPRVLPRVLLALGLMASVAAAEEWGHARVSRLPDSAFAVVERTADDRAFRHLPHHDETGAVDQAHLRAARARLAQVKWLDPANAAIATHHLEEHERETRPPRR